MAKVVAIILAAGSGTRCKTQLPKQYVYVAGRPVVMWSIDAFRNAISGIKTILVINPDTKELWEELCIKHGFESPRLVSGGSTRWESVKNAISTITADDDTIVLVHDGARPAVDAETICGVVETAVKCDGAIPVVPVTDSLRVLNTDGTSEAVDRSLYRAVQTPQGFKLDKLLRAYNVPYRTEFTDDASVMEYAGYKDLRLTTGSPDNIKLTFAADFQAIENILKNR